MLNLFINNQNIMKTYQLILAAALVALASCTKATVDPVNTAKAEGDEIGFNVVNQKATKADDAIITGTTYGTDNHFNVWGWQSEAGDFSDVADNATSNFMTGLKIEWTKGRDNTRAEAWRNATNYYYWPFTGKISFLAIHPFTVAPTTVKWDDTNKKAKATIDNYTIDGDTKTTDLMFATNEGTRASNGDTPVNMVFKHALSQIQFRVRTNDNYTLDDVVFTVNSVTIHNIDLSGNVSYAWDNTLTTPAMAISWSNNNTQDENWAYYATPQEVTYAATDTEADLYGAANVMIPQPANADNTATPAVIEGTTITINYTMQQKTYPATTAEVTVAAPWTKVKEGDTEHDPAVAFAAWEPGKKYNYTLNFNLKEILFNPSAENWVSVDVATIDVLY